MKKLFIASGYDSFNNKDMRKAFNSESDANQYIDGLTDPHIQVISYKSTVELINYYLKAA
jgi:hypothetical protein